MLAKMGEDAIEHARNINRWGRCPHRRGDRLRRRAPVHGRRHPPDVAVARAIRWPRTRSYLVQLARYDRFDRDKQHEDPEGEELMR